MPTIYNNKTKEKVMGMQVVKECNVLCITMYYKDRSAVWHERITGKAQLLEETIAECGGIVIKNTRMMFQGQTFSVSGLRPGLDGMCVAFIVDAKDGVSDFWALYSDIPIGNATEAEVRQNAERTINSRRGWRW